MKLRGKLYILILIAITISSVLIASDGATIAEPGLSARSRGDDVVITWQTVDETNLKHFVVQRKSSGSTFMDLDQVLSESDQYYEYVDETAYKITESIYIYRVAIVTNSGSITYSKEVTVLHDNISSVKKTWGSIKALFR